MGLSPLAGAQAGLGLLQTGIGLFSLIGKKKASEKTFKDIETYTDSPYAKANLQQAQADVNAPMPGEQEAKMAIGQSQTQGLNAAKSRKGALQSVGAIVGQAIAGKQNLATQKAQFGIGAKNRLSGARDKMTVEYGKSFKSRQDKQVLAYQKSLAELQSAKSTISQGLGAIGGAAANAAKMGQGDVWDESDNTKGLGASAGGIFGKAIAG